MKYCVTVYRKRGKGSNIYSSFNAGYVDWMTKPIYISLALSRQVLKYNNDMDRNKNKYIHRIISNESTI